MKTAQRSEFWTSQNISKNEIYNPNRQRALQAHIAAHSMPITTTLKYSALNPNLGKNLMAAAAQEGVITGDGESYVVDGSDFYVSKTRMINLFLRAKSGAYVDRAVNEVAGQTKEQIIDRLEMISRKRTLGVEL